MQTKITESLVQKMLASPPAKDTSVFDTELPRFAFRVKPARADNRPPAAWFFIRYTLPGWRHEKRMKVGAVTMKVIEARKAARAKLAQVDQGRDPGAERAQTRAMPTIKDLAVLYSGSDDFKGKTPLVQTNDKARLEHHILRHLAGTKADAITPGEARKMVRAITTDTRMNSRKRRMGGPGAARKAVRLLAAMLAWAKGEEIIPTIPFALRDLKLDGDGQREAVITEVAEYARLFETIDRLAAEGSLRPEVRAFFVLVASTGLRRGEAQALRWGQVDLARRQITLTGSKGLKLARKRGGAAMQEIVGIPPVAAEALRRIAPDDIDDGALVFEPAHGAKLSVNRDWLAVRKAAGLPPELTLHGLRHSVGTVGAIRGMSMPELQALLRHKQPGTTARYLHLAQASGGLADKAMGGVLPGFDEARADVVPLRRGGRR
jgi:integrase